MSNFQNIQKGVFDALLLHDSLERLRENGIVATPEPLNDYPQQSIDIRDFSPVIRHRASRMQQAYVSFFCLENAVRDLISQRLAERHGANWWDSKVPQKIKQHVEQLKSKEEKNRYLSIRSSQNIGYTVFGHLSQIIIANWADFDDLFPDQAWVTSRFSDLEACRNIIMHTNELPEIEITRINAIVRDWLSQVG